MTQAHSFSDLFKNKAFMLLWLNQFCVQLAYSMTNFALILWVYELTKRNIFVSLLLLFISVPSIVFGIYAGTFADRMSRKRIIQTTDILLAILFLLFSLSQNWLWGLYLLAFLVSLVSQFFLPAEGASIPSVVSKELLVHANSLFSLTIYASLIIGYALAGPLIDASGSYVFPFFVAAVLTGIGSVLISQFPMEQKKIKDKMKSRFTDSWQATKTEIQEGVRYIFAHKVILISILLLTGVQAMISVLSVLVPEYIQKILQIPSTRASYIIMLPLGLGLISGAFFIAAYAKYFSRRKLVEYAILGVSISLLVLAFAPVISDFIAFQVVELSTRLRRPLEHILGLSGLLIIFSYFLGFFNVCIVVPAQTLLHETTSEELRGRVFGTLNMMMSSIAVLPVVIVGTLADTFGTVSLLSSMAFLVLAVALALQSRRLVGERLTYKR